MKSWIFLVPCLLLGTGLSEQLKEPAPVAAQRTERLILEEKHFLECLAYVYSPAFWISYKGSVYFLPTTEAQLRQIESLKTARAKYVVLTNRETRHQLAAAALAQSGLDDTWQHKLLLPYSPANPNLTPTLNRAVGLVSDYRLIERLEEGDALLESQGKRLLVMDFAGDAGAGIRTNLCLIKEGERAFAKAPGQYDRVEAFRAVNLTTQDKTRLNRAVAAFQKKAAALGQELATFKAREQFEESKARATDNNPYMQYLVARCYLEGKGTPRDEKLGLEWMSKAASNGSGDAKTYLAGRGEKPE